MFILFVTVTVYTFVYCQLVNMGIVYFDESIKEERERDWGSLVGGGGIREIKSNPAQKDKANRGTLRHPPKPPTTSLHLLPARGR